MSCQKRSVDLLKVMNRIWYFEDSSLFTQLVKCFLMSISKAACCDTLLQTYSDCRSEVASGTRACGARCSVASSRWVERKMFGHIEFHGDFLHQCFCLQKSSHMQKVEVIVDILYVRKSTSSLDSNELSRVTSNDRFLFFHFCGVANFSESE